MECVAATLRPCITKAYARVMMDSRRSGTEYSTVAGTGKGRKPLASASTPADAVSHLGSPGGMSSPSKTPNPAAAANAATGDEMKRAEGVKAYYQGLTNNYRIITQQLQLPDLPPARRQQLTAQLEKLQALIQDFTERVIRPIVNANRAASASGSAASVPPSVGTPVQSTPNMQPQMVRTRHMARAPSTTRDPAPTPLSMVSVDAPRGVMLSVPTATYLEQTRLSEGVLTERGAPSKRRQISAGSASNGSLLSAILPAEEAAGLELDASVEEVLLSLADRFVASVCQGVCESARHRKRPGISMRDLELVISREVGLAATVAGVPFAVPPAAPVKAPNKKMITANPHYHRLQHLRKHLGLL